MKRTARAALGLTAIATFAISACGSDSKPDTTTGPVSTEAPAGSTAPAGSAAPAASDAPAGSEAPAGSQAPAGAAAGTITIKDFKFDIPSGLKAGDTVMITNADKANHTFTDKDGKFDVKVDAGKSVEFTVPAAGTYSIICTIHPSMSGEMTVA